MSHDKRNVSSTGASGRALYDNLQLAEISKLERDVSAHLSSKPHRLEHSLAVGECAESLALTYGLDPYPARCAGILHDWDKALTADETISIARERGVDMGVDIALVRPLLHGILAAQELPTLYPELPPEVFQAICRHTTAAVDMSPLDEVVFVADGIEPNRPASDGIAKARSLVGEVSLDDLFWESFVGGIIYVLQGSRYLYPGTIDIYNGIAAHRSTHKENE
ncbi:MAG: bis(5'-nucleosyl)-tetraphosphatase (symmetrical) YqeK [Atopobiaceae bacterium]|nr:bis(5'-nucleosyl)-tetraphosphatase (symmetrical) YqeK [Atopobiaceae bacterium]MCI2173154.1 bis(5'-nucleosyl)-tetraphosphatase (symmetrical) YqeK [Atopobiaceae bacterium]MCI2208247.1 bis(5'-nucleosyl)-tetraphosphatase (symmetrical) YqeK [Atopobiaceae bacterium]